MNARKKAKEKKAVTHTWFTKVFSTRLSHSGKTRSQAMPQKQWKWIFLWHLVKLRMGSAISEVESTLLEIFIWILPGLQQQLWAILGKKKKSRSGEGTGDVQLSGKWLEATEENQYFARSCQPDSIHLVISSSGQPPLLPIHEYIILNNSWSLFLDPPSHRQASLFWH